MYALIAGFTPIELAVVVTAACTVAVGLYISVQAYRALRRHGGRQMLYLSVGMVLTFGAAYLVSLVGTLLLRFRILPLPAQDPFRLAIRVLQLLGLLAIAYSLHLRK